MLDMRIRLRCNDTAGSGREGIRAEFSFLPFHFTFDAIVEAEIGMLNQICLCLLAFSVSFSSSPSFLARFFSAILASREQNRFRVGVN